MKRYWDHSEAERAALTEEQIARLLAYELMERGVLDVAPLRLTEAAPLQIPTRRVFVLHEAASYSGGGTTPIGIGFETAEQAEVARSAIRFVRESAWNEPAHVRAVRQIQIVAEDLPSEIAVAERKAALDEAQRVDRANAEERRRYEADCKKVSDETSDLRNDWRRCREAETRHQKIRATLADYLQMTDGNETLARGFLAKVFPPDEIAEALPPMPPVVA